jgi:hypothetical protein
MKRFFLLLFATAPLQAFSQIDSAEWRLSTQAIRETLPAYLNECPASLAYYLPGGELDKMMKQIYGSLEKLSSDKEEKKEFREEIQTFQLFADSVKTVLETQKISVATTPRLTPYVYAPDDPEFDLRDPDSWAIEKESTIERFTTNDLVQLKQPISGEFVDLIGQQIGQTFSAATLGPLEQLDYSYYSYKDLSLLQEDTTIYLKILEVNWPVFNKKKTRGCYLVTIEGNEVEIRNFIFIEKKKGTWTYIDSWPTYMIGDDVNPVDQEAIEEEEESEEE